ncbi:MAG TPA: pre-16S rRNA-processing nuclease YqgF [Candidatus Binatia bacterium]|nr:pre-16S rRNA-processing nuclease YqgF [Candidatus Binatia bacterium]
MNEGAVLGIDPGRSKAGYALLDDSGAVVAAGIEPLERLDGCVRELLARVPVTAIALGRGTNSGPVRAALMHFDMPIHLVDEYETSRLARGLYFADHPPRGWRRLIPLGLQLPPRPIDDYAAILIARRFLARGDEARPPS